jgi:serine/threonine protein kinase
MENHRLIPDPIGQLDEHYLLLERIGHGASCKVFLAYDNLNHVHVAIKVPKAGIANE